MKYDLSILIPARCEEFLALTVQDILKNKRGKTEIIIGLDGQWSNPGIPDHPDVTILYVPLAIGQRAITNQLARLSTAKYVFKVDAHCIFDEGFDQKMMDDMQDDWTMVPVMTNLHAFDWVCPAGHRRYQSPSGPCTQCGKPTTKDIIFKSRKRTPHSTSYRFDKTLHFQYFGEYKKVQDATGSHLVETMSLQGSCFMLTREKYWELNICDEEHGSWGQQGTEVACKTWLSGGRVVCNKNTWYSHLFRTQGGDFSFPYPNPGSLQDKARKYSRELFLNGKWDKAIHPLSWLIEKFSPVPGWDAPSKGIIYYTDNQLDPKLAEMCREQLLESNLPIVSASLEPISFGTNIVLPLKRGYIAYFKQIIAALEASTADIIFFCEHDVLYHPSHFDFVPARRDKFYYNQNVWRLKYPEDLAVTWDADQVAELCTYRETALHWYRRKLAEVEAVGLEKFNRKFEPGSENAEPNEVWRSEEPNIDIRHGHNLTKSKWSIDDFRNKSSAKNFQQGLCPEWARKTIWQVT